MKRFVFLMCLCFFATAISTTLFGCDAFKSHGVAPGDLAPEISLVDLDGKKVSTSDLKGKVLLINFWATWCGPCILELPGLEKLHQQLQSKNFSVLSVAIDDDQDSLAQMKAEYGLSFPILNDVDGKAKSAYRIAGVPESFIVDADGKVVLFLDPESGEPTARVSGPREWESAGVVQQIEKLLGNAS